MNAQASRVLILDTQRIERKILRMAWQIWEHNSNRQSLTLIGIAGSGEAIADKLAGHLRDISSLAVTVLKLELSKKDPVQSPVTVSDEIRDDSVVLVDDVANSGRTLLYALKPVMDAGPKQILISVLVNRKHKSFPVSPDIIGHQVATTLQENIVVSQENGKMVAYLE